MTNLPNYHNKSLIPNWGKILLDTTAVIKVLDYLKNKKEENLFYYETIKNLTETKYQYEKSNKGNKQGENYRQFFVSAISLAEILCRLENGVKKSQHIVKAFNAKNMTILDFDEDVANVFNVEFCESMGVKVQNDILQRWGESPSKNNRQALTNDIMILATGQYHEVDVILCVDKGMYKIAREHGLNVAYLDKKYFKISGSNYFEYNTPASDLYFNVTQIKSLKDEIIFAPKESETDSNI